MMAMQWLLNKKMVIMGGTEGLGLSAALACMAEGANLVVVGKDSGRNELEKEALGGRVSVMLGDAREESLAEKAIQTCVKKFGGFDGLYHVAGGSGRKFGDGPLHEMTAEGWRETLDLNLNSLMYSNKAALKFFIANAQPGVILNMGSVLGTSPSPKHFSTHAYSACKSAIIGLCKSTASQYAPYGIRINVIAPGLIQTPMSKRAAEDPAIMKFVRSKQPLDGGRIGMPKDLDGAVVFLLSDHAKWITGQVIAVDGGWSVSEGQY
jgi:NAD(P)-dependent dehydrogenase (short-subunit alcohol dehydrogenase family)